LIRNYKRSAAFIIDKRLREKGLATRDLLVYATASQLSMHILLLQTEALYVFTAVALGSEEICGILIGGGCGHPYDP